MFRLGSQVLALKSLETLINQAVKLDPGAWNQVQHLQGQRLSLKIEGVPLAFQMAFTKEGVTLPMGPFIDQKLATTEVRGPLGDFIALVKAEDKQAALAQSQIEIHGQSALLLQLANIAQNLHIDWPSALQPVLGPVATQLLVKAQQKAGAEFKKTQTAFRADLYDYAHNEAVLSPYEWEVQAFCDQVHRFRSDCDRLAARVQRLKHRLAQQQMPERPVSGKNTQETGPQSL